MPRRVYSFDRPDRFICGAVGEPGQRTFFLQATKGGQVVSVALEKAQVAILAERLATLLLTLRQGGVEVGEDPPGQPQRLEEPVVEQFRVGLLTLGWDGDHEQIVIEARELGDEDVEIDDAESEDEPVATVAGEQELQAEEPVMSFVAAEVDEDLDVVRVQLAPPAALAFASGALAVVQAGRPPCPQCGAPLDPTGHFCPRRNGYTH
ncbi:MAG TPA: DUF3090 family protein [Candidatus Limnocylindrales bacterium]|nr:DUF3090 family protein [Candidatus Limnocylindrales bacterium]